MPRCVRGAIGALTALALGQLTVVGGLLVSCSDQASSASGTSRADRSAVTVSPVATSSAMATDPERPSPHDPSLALREQLVFQIRTRGSPWPGVRWDERVLGVVGEVPRHHFAPGVDIAAAYRDTPQPIGFAQTISQPTVVAMMTQALELTGGEKVLEIGTGSGYQAAVLSKLSREVYSIELVETLAERSSAQLAQDGYVNVKVRAGDGYAGWPEHAPFDRIIVTAAPPELPPALVEQLAVGGILVAPVGPEGKLQRLYRYRKTARGLGQEDLGGVFFVPMVESGR